MDPIIILKYIGLFLAAYLTIKHLILGRRKNLPPSPPFSLPIIGHFYLLTNPFHQSLAKLSSKYGPVLYLKFGARPVLIISDPDIVEDCIVRKDCFVDRPALLPARYTTYNYPNIPWVPHGPLWRNLRKISAVEILSPQRLQILSKVRSEVGRTFLSELMKGALENKKNDDCFNDTIVEMKTTIFQLTLDNMMRMLVGRTKYEEGMSKSTSELLARFQEMVEESFRVSGVTSNVDDFMPRWFMAVFGRKAAKAAVARIKKVIKEKETFMTGLLEEHRHMEKEGTLSDAQLNSMLNVLLTSQKNDPKGYSDEMIGCLVLTLFQGGTDTSASTIVWALSLLLNHPYALKKAQAEIDEVVGSERFVEESDRNNLPFIQSIINETFRICPTGPLALPYESRVDCQVGGYDIPKGTMMLYNIWAIHNDPKYWPNPRTYDPERFIGLEEKRFGCEYMPFGTGKRICPGEHLASRVVWLSVALLIQCFEWNRIDDKLVDLKEGDGLTLPKIEPLLVKYRPRPSMLNLLSQL